MAQIILTPAQRKDHRAEAHHLNPVVMIGSDGLTDAVKKETDAALKAHGLIKIRVLSDDRTGRDSIFHTLADELNAAPHTAHRQAAGALASRRAQRKEGQRRPHGRPP
jgi:RNA-binding protein